MTKVVLRTAAVTAIAYRTIQFFRDSHLIPAQTAAKEAGRFFKLANFKLPSTGYKVADMVRGAAIFHPLVTTASVTTGWLGLEALFQAGSKPAAPHKVTIQDGEWNLEGLTITMPADALEGHAVRNAKILPADVAIAFDCLRIATSVQLSEDRLVALRSEDAAHRGFAAKHDLDAVGTFLDEGGHLAKASLEASDTAMFPTKTEATITIPEGRRQALSEMLGKLYTDLVEGRVMAKDADLAFACILIALDNEVINLGNAGRAVRDLGEDRIAELRQFVDDYTLRNIGEWLGREKYVEHVTLAVGDEYEAGTNRLTVTQEQLRRLPEAVAVGDYRVSIDALESCILWLLGKEDRALCFRHKKESVIEEAKAFAREHELTELQDYLEKEEYKVHTKVAFHEGDLTIDAEGIKLPERMREALADREQLMADIAAGRLEYPLPVAHDCLKVVLAAPGTEAYQKACLDLKRRYPEGSAISTPTRNAGKDLPDRAAFAEHYQLDATFWSAAKFRKVVASGDAAAARLEVTVADKTNVDDAPVTLSQEDFDKLPEAVKEAIRENKFGAGYPDYTIRLALQWLVADDKQVAEARCKEEHRDIGEETFDTLFDALNGGNKLFKAFDLTEGPDWAAIGRYCCPQLRVGVKDGAHTKGLFERKAFLLEASEAPRSLTFSEAMMGRLQERAPKLHAAIDGDAFRGLEPAILNNCLALVLDKAAGLPDSARGKGLIACIDDDHRAYKMELEKHLEFAEAFELQGLSRFFDEQLLAIDSQERRQADLDWR
jgi:hypothetical protein